MSWYGLAQPQLVFPLPRFTTLSIPNATVGTAYNVHIFVSNLVGPPTFTVTGSTGNWLTINNSGFMGGTPTVADSETVTVSVTDGRGMSASINYSLTVNAGSSPVQIANASLANPVVGVAYSQAITITGGTPPYRAAIVSMAPHRRAWCWLDPSTNVLRGTPQYNETSVITLQAWDSLNNTSGPTAFTFTAKATGALSVVTTSLANASSGGLCQWEYIAQGGVPPYVWGTPSALAAANLTFPATGYCLLTNGLLTAVPTGAAATNLAAVTVTDSTGATATSAAITQTIDTNLRFNLIDSVDHIIRLPVGYAGDLYGGSGNLPRFTAAGGTAPYTFSGSIAGLTVSANGALAGTLTSNPGTYVATFTVQDSVANLANATALITILPDTTGTRPAYNTSSAMYVAGGILYDTTNTPVMIRGFNRDHYDQPSSTLPKAMESANRNTSYLQSIAMSTYTNDFNNNGLAYKLLPVWTPFFTVAGAKISGTTDPTTIGQILGWIYSNFSTLSPYMNKIVFNWANEWGAFGGMTAAQMNAAYLGAVDNITNISGTTITCSSNHLATAGSAWAFLSGAGSNANQVINVTSAGGNTYTSSVSLSAATTGTLNAGIAGMRAAGFTWPVVIDSPGGQNWPNLSAVALGIQQSDPIQNCIFSWHAYNDATPSEVQIKSVAVSGANTILTLNSTGSQFLGSSQHPFRQLGTGSGSFAAQFGVSVQGATGPWAVMNGHYFSSSQGAGMGGSSPNWTITIPFNAAAQGLTAGTYVANSGVAFDDSNPIDWCARRAADRANNLCWIVGEFGPFGHYGTDAWTVLNHHDVIQAAESYGLGWMYWAWDDERGNDYCMVNNSPSPAFTTPQNLNPQNGQPLISHPRLSWYAISTPLQQYLP